MLADRTIRLAAIALATTALAIGVVTVTDAWRMVGRPWIGFPIQANGQVAPPVLIPPRIAARGPMPGFHDLVLAVDGVPVSDAAHLRRQVAGQEPGHPARYTFEGPDGTTYDLVIPLVRFTRADLGTVYLPLMIGGFVGLLFGLVPVLARPALAAARAFHVFNVGLALNFGFLAFDYFVAHRFVPWSLLAGALATGGLMYMALLIPSPLPPVRDHPRATLAAVAVLNGAFWLIYGIINAPRWKLVLDTVEVGLFVAGSLTLVGNMLWSLRPSVNGPTRQLARVSLWSLIATLPGGALFLAVAFGWVHVQVPMLVYLLPLWLLGGLVAYVMVAHNLFELDAVVRRSLTVALIVLGALAVQLTLLAVLSRAMAGAPAWAVAGIVTILVVASIAAVAPLRQHVEELIQRTFFPRLTDAWATVHEASRELARLHGEHDIVRVLRAAAAKSVATDDLRLAVGMPDEPLTEVSPADAVEPLVLPATDPVVGVLRRGVSMNFQAPRHGRGGPSKAALRRAAELGVALAVPLPQGEGRVGGLLVGARTDGRLHTRDDEILLETLAAQTAVAVEHARAWAAVQALEGRLREENLYLREEIDQVTDTGGEMVGNSPALRAVLAQLDRVAPTEAPVLITGETGTGKELLVRALHARSPRADRILVKVACAALPENLFESELFGFERGAFTGATAAKAGRLEVADRGTLFLDDVDTMPLAVQAKLLRALQEGEIQRLGSNDVRHVDVRVVAATNRDLLAEVRAGNFREDLYYRLNVVPLRLPPLRERREDVPLLVEHFIRQEAPRLGRNVRAVSAEAMAALSDHHWPGNIRELRNVVQRALVFGSDEILRLPAPLASDDPRPATTGLPFADQVREFKIRVLRDALARSGGNQRIAAEILGLHRQSLTRMIHDLGLQEPPPVQDTATRKSERPRTRAVTAR